MAKLPDPGKKDVVRIPVDREVREILEGLSAAARVELSGARVAAKDLGHLEIDQMRRVQRFARRQQAGRDANARGRVQQELDGR